MYVTKLCINNETFQDLSHEVVMSLWMFLTDSVVGFIISQFDGEEFTDKGWDGV